MSARRPQLPQSPASVGKLEKYVLAHANREGLAVGRVRHWISFMMLSGALDQAAGRQGGPRFIVKGLAHGQLEHRPTSILHAPRDGGERGGDRHVLLRPAATASSGVGGSGRGVAGGSAPP